VVCQQVDGAGHALDLSSGRDCIWKRRLHIHIIDPQLTTSLRDGIFTSLKRRTSCRSRGLNQVMPNRALPDSDFVHRLVLQLMGRSVTRYSAGIRRKPRWGSA
jgi:hypothetical protein